MPTPALRAIARDGLVAALDRPEPVLVDLAGPIWFAAGGTYADQNPYFVHRYLGRDHPPDTFPAGAEVGQGVSPAGTRQP